MSLPARVRPPADGDERALLVGWLDLQRLLVHYTCEGLAEDSAHRVLLLLAARVGTRGEEALAR